MKHTRLLILMIFIAVFYETSAQEKKLTTEAIVMHGRSTLAPQRIQALKWIKGTDMYSYNDTTGGEKIVRGSVKNNDVVLLTLTDLNMALRNAGHDTLKKLPAYEWDNHQLLSFTAQDTLFGYNLILKSVKVLFVQPAGLTAENITRYEKTGSVAFTVNNQLWLFHNGTYKKIAGSTDSSIVFGQAVHREEFGIHEGIYWSPKGNFLAFYRMDQTMVTDYPIINWMSRPAQIRQIKYPFAGDSSHHVTIGIYNLATGHTTYLKTGKPDDQYLTNIAWSPDELKVYVAIVNRQQNHLWMNRYNALTGDYEKTLFEEHDDRYVQPLNKMAFVTGNNHLFIWQSRRDGYNHLYLYNTEGKLLRQLTSGRWEVTAFDGFSSDGKYAFFTAALHSSVTRDYCKVELTSGKMKTLTSGLGMHTILSCDSKRYFIDSYSSLVIPRMVSIRDHNGKEVKNLLQAPDPLKDYKPVSTEILKLKSSSGYELFCRMTRPKNMEPGKRYPVIIYVYNGPGLQLVNDQWPAGNELWYHYMAQHDYIVFTLDGRGTPNRGREFEQAIFRQLGVMECEDQMAGVGYLKSLPYVDSTRIGVYGWSYGGFMAASLMTRYPDVFKTGVAGGPVTDWKLYEVMYTERYMDTPAENPEGYEKTNVINRVASLKGRLLLIHGTDDDVVVQQHSMLFLKKAIDLNKPVEFFLYPGHPHNITGKDRINLFDKISGFFFRYL